MSISPVLKRSAMGLAPLAILLTALIPAGASAGAAGNHPSSAHLTALTFSRTGPQPIVLPVRSLATRHNSCANVRANLTQYAARGIHQVMCITSGQPVQIKELPKLCQTNAEHVLRFEDCLSENWGFDYYNTQTGALIGVFNGITTYWNTLSYKSRIWPENVEVRNTKVTGIAKGTTFTAPLVCNDMTPGDCQTTGTGSWKGQTGYLPAVQGAVYTGELGFGSAATSITTMYFTDNMVIDTPGFPPQDNNIFPTTNIRCDSESYFRPTRGGCAYPIYTLNILKLHITDPTIHYAAEFISNAQAAISTHAGNLDFGKPLTRTTDKSTIRSNRRVACKGVTVPPGDSCDEYPFATTNQGASKVPRKDYRAQAVPAAQNSKVGAYLSSFYLKNRILATNPTIAADPFYVDILYP